MVYHSGVCPKVKEIEYWPSGIIKKVEFRERAQMLNEAMVNLATYNPKSDEPTDEDLVKP